MRQLCHLLASLAAATAATAAPSGGKFRKAAVVTIVSCDAPWRVSNHSQLRVLNDMWQQVLDHSHIMPQIFLSSEFHFISWQVFNHFCWRANTVSTLHSDASIQGQLKEL